MMFTCLPLCIMTSSDIISKAEWRKWGCIPNFTSSKNAPGIPLRFGCPTFPGLQSASVSNSHSLFLLLFFIHQIAFHSLPLLNPPLPATTQSFSRLMSLFPPDFFKLYLLSLPPTAAILEQKSIKMGRDSLTRKTEPCLLHSCQGNHFVRSVCVVLTAVSLSSSIWVKVIGISCGCIIVQSVPVASWLIWSQLRQRECVLQQSATAHSSWMPWSSLSRWLEYKLTVWVRHLLFLWLPAWNEVKKREVVQVLTGWKKVTETRQSFVLFTFLQSYREELGLMTQSPAFRAELDGTWASKVFFKFKGISK